MNEIETLLADMTSEQKFAFAILCAMEVCDNDEWRIWARGWLSGEDRSRDAAKAAKSALKRACDASAWAAAGAVSSDHASVAAWSSSQAVYLSLKIATYPLDVTAISKIAMEVN